MHDFSNDPAEVFGMGRDATHKNPENRRGSPVQLTGAFQR